MTLEECAVSQLSEKWQNQMASLSLAGCRFHLHVSADNWTVSTPWINGSIIGTLKTVIDWAEGQRRRVEGS